MIYCIEVPHQMNARLVSYRNAAEIINEACNNNNWEWATNHMTHKLSREGITEPKEEDFETAGEYDKAFIAFGHVTNYMTLEDAKEIVTHDLNSSYWIETEEDLQYALKATGHQSIAVQALAAGIEL